MAKVLKLLLLIITLLLSLYQVNASIEPENDISKSHFEIDTAWFWIGLTSSWWGAWSEATSTEKANFFLWKLISKLMIALSSIALIIMVIWWWYMALNLWEDDQLSKWKTIFKTWVYALVIALSSYFIVSFIRYVLYSTTSSTAN